MSNRNEWDINVLALLGNVIRELQFDWSAIAQKLKNFIYEANETLIEVTPAICRQQYAKDYSKKSVVVVPVSAPVVIEIPLEVIKIANNDIVTTEKYVSTVSTQQIYKKYNDVTVEELLIHVDDKEKLMNKRKEEIFQIVLNSLGE